MLPCPHQARRYETELHAAKNQIAALEAEVCALRTLKEVSAPGGFAPSSQLQGGRSTTATAAALAQTLDRVQAERGDEQRRLVVLQTNNAALAARKSALAQELDKVRMENARLQHLELMMSAMMRAMRMEHDCQSEALQHTLESLAQDNAALHSQLGAKQVGQACPWRHTMRNRLVHSALAPLFGCMQTT
jgi:hypothetical protein